MFRFKDTSVLKHNREKNAGLDVINKSEKLAKNVKKRLIETLELSTSGLHKTPLKTKIYKQEKNVRNEKKRGRKKKKSKHINRQK